MKQLFLVLIMSSASSIAEALDLRPDNIAILAGSHHLNATGPAEEFNPGIFLSWHGDWADTRAGCFRNTYDDMSCAVTWASEKLALQVGELSATPFVGFAHYGENAFRLGWADLGDGYVLIGGAELTHEAAPIFVQLLPGDGETVDAVFTFGFSFDF